MFRYIPLFLFFSVTLQAQSENVERVEMNSPWKTFAHDNYDISFPSTWTLVEKGPLGMDFYIYPETINSTESLNNYICLKVSPQQDSVLFENKMVQPAMERHIQEYSFDREEHFGADCITYSAYAKKAKWEYHKMIYKAFKGIHIEYWPG